MSKASVTVLLLAFTSAFSHLCGEVIDLNGDVRDLATSPIVFGTDSVGTTSIKNATFVHVCNDNRLIGANSNTKLVLQTVTLSLDDTYSFTQGELVIIGDVKILGPNKTFHLNNVATTIAAGATLEVGPSVLFEYSPTGSGTRAIFLEDSSSRIVLDSCGLRTNAPMGMNLFRGGLTVRGAVTVESTVTQTHGSVRIGTGVLSDDEFNAGEHNDGDCTLLIEEGGKLIINKGGCAIRNQSARGVAVRGELALQPQSDVILSGSYDNGGAPLRINAPRLDGTHFIGVPTAISLLPSANVAHAVSSDSVIYTTDWSSDGRFLAIAGDNGTNDRDIRVYTFTGTALTELTGSSTQHGARVNRARFSPDGRFLAACGAAAPGNITVRVYEFDEANVSVITNADSVHGATLRGLAWAPSGKFLAVCGDNGSGNANVRVYSFDGFNLTEIDDAILGASVTNVTAVDWHPGGAFLAAGGEAGTGGFEVRIYSFDAFALTEVVSFDHDSRVEDLAWSPDGKHLAMVGASSSIRVCAFDGATSLVTKATSPSGSLSHTSVSWSPGGRALVVGSNDATSVPDIRVYRFTGESLIESASATHRGGSGNDVLSVAWSPDESYISMGGDGTGVGDDAEARVFQVLHATGTADPVTLSNVKLELLSEVVLHNAHLGVG